MENIALSYKVFEGSESPAGFFKIIFIVAIWLWLMLPYVDSWLLDEANKKLDINNKLADTLKTTVYILDKQKWTEFSLLPKNKFFRVLSNATLPQALTFNKELKWQYALQYQFLDKEGNLLKEGNYHHRTNSTIYQDSDTKEFSRPVFYMTPEQQPTNGRYMFIDISDISSKAAWLRFRLLSADEQVSDVGIRVYWLEMTDEDKLKNYMWQRLNKKKKKTLARGNVYEYGWLNQMEIRNLLRQKWTVMGPIGVAGREYHPRAIYIRRKIEGETIPLPVQRYGIFVDPLHLVTLPLEEHKGLIRLSFSQAQPLPGQSPTKPPVTINIKWYGQESTERAEHSFVWDGSEKAFEHEFVGGLLEISTSQPVIMRAFLNQANQLVEITPSPQHSSATLIQGDMKADFPFNHYSRQAIPVRVKIRRLLEAQEPPPAKGKISESIPVSPFSLSLQTGEACNVTYTLFDTKGRVRKTGMMPLTQSRSIYDRTKGSWWGKFEVSEADKYYLSIPTKIARLRLTSPCAALASVYNQPLGLSLKKRIPEDFFQTANDSQQQSLWFRLRPKDYESLPEQNRSLLLGVQSRPPRENEEQGEILKGNYLWESFKPNGKYRSRYLFVKRDSQLPIRNQALGVIYQPIPKNRLVKLQFINPKKVVRPSLIYRRSQKKPALIRILLDNKLYYKGHVTGFRGNLRLPKISARAHTMVLNVKGEGQFFINHAKPKKGQTLYIKHLAHFFDSKGLQFTYKKRSHDKELLSVRVYMPFGKQERLQVRVKLIGVPKKNMRAYTGWTFTQRYYDLRPLGEEPVMVLNTRNDLLDGGQFFVVPLQDDLPPGQYKIELKPEKSVGAYMTLNKMTVGLKEERREIFRSSW